MFEQAYSHFQRATEIMPAAAQPRLLMALTRLMQGKLDDAEAEARRAIQLDPAGSFFHATLGRILKDKGDLRGAVSEFQTELTLHPDFQAEQIKAQIRALQTDLAALHR